MAEHFCGQNHTIHFTNGGAECLLGAWIKLGERMDATPANTAVVAYLRHRLYDHYDGWRAFSLYPPPPALATPERLRCLAQIIAVFANELTQDDPDPTLTDITWDRELRLLWLTRMAELYELIDEALPPDARPLDPLDI